MKLVQNKFPFDSRTLVYTGTRGYIEPRYIIIGDGIYDYFYDTIPVEMFDVICGSFKESLQ
jgi:hypothetical protein